MKLNERMCKLTEELDKLAGLTGKPSSKFFHHYILIGGCYEKKRCFPIRVPGGTVGSIWVDDNNVITKIIIETDYVIKTYPKDINELIQKFVGMVIKY